MFLNISLDKYNSFVFDNDGVIMDSNSAKTAAFAKALEGEDQILINKFLQYHKDFGGVSRFKKFEYFFIEIKQQKKYLNALDKALKKYATYSKEALVNAELLPGIEDYLSILKKSNKNVFVVSGSDQEELLDVYNSRNISKYFTRVLGSPKSKTEILHKLTENKILSYPAIYFGDAKLDYLTAKRFDLDFVFISSKSDWKEGAIFCKNMGCVIKPNFIED